MRSGTDKKDISLINNDSWVKWGFHLIIMYYYGFITCEKYTKCKILIIKETRDKVYETLYSTCNNSVNLKLSKNKKFVEKKKICTIAIKGNEPSA